MSKGQAETANADPWRQNETEISPAGAEAETESRDLRPEQSHDWTWTAAVRGLLQADAVTRGMRRTHVRANIHRLGLRCIIVNQMIITPFSPCHFNLNVSAGECMAVLVHKQQYLNLSVQSHRKYWVVCAKPKISYLSENHPVKRHSLSVSVQFNFHSGIVNCNVYCPERVLHYVWLYKAIFLTIFRPVDWRYSCHSFSLSLIYLWHTLTMINVPFTTDSFCLKWLKIVSWRKI